MVALTLLVALSSAGALGAAVAALGAGVSRDALARYLPTFVVAGVACLAAAGLALALRPPRTAPATTAAAAAE